MSRGRNGWKIALGIAVSLVCLGLALRNIDFQQLAAVFKRLDPWWTTVAAGFVLAAYFLRALLWYSLIRPRKKTRLWNLFRIITIGYLANNLLPLKLGELLRAWLLGRQEALPTSLAIGTVVVERILDLFVLLFYFVVMMFFVPFAAWLKMSGLILAGIGVGMLGMLIVSYRFADRLAGLLEKPLQRLPGGFGPWLHAQLVKFLEGLQLVRTPGQLTAAVGWCLLTWLAWMCVAFFCALAFGVSLPFLAAVFLIVVLNFGLMIPSSPGGLGVFEFMVILALAAYGVSKEAALGIGFTFHMLHFLLTIVGGWLFAVQMNVSVFKVYSHPEKMDAALGE